MKISSFNLDDVWRESETCLEFVCKGKYRDAAEAIVSQRQFVRNLRGQTANFSTFSEADFDERSFEAPLTEDRMTPMVGRYWILKVQARFLSADYDAGLAAAEKAKELHWSSEAFFQSLAGADCFYAPGIKDLLAIRTLVSAVAPKPVNVLLIGPNMRVADLADAGVRRLSVGGRPRCRCVGRI